MLSESTDPIPKLDLTIRCGFELAYEASAPTPAVLLLHPKSNALQFVEQEHFTFEPRIPVREVEDGFGNTMHMLVLPAGRTTIVSDAIVAVPSIPENVGVANGVAPIDELPDGLLRYTLPSRYCDSDKLLDFSFQQFGHLARGVQQVQAICDWIHTNIEYRWGAGSSQFAASDILSQRFGVCRDFAHLGIALCRSLNMPARYVTGYVPDIAFQDPGTPMDFHAYFQVYLGGDWRTFDARFNVPRIGRIHIARGLDAVEGAFSTLYGSASLVSFNVWAYQVDDTEVRAGDPLDLSKRLDGTPELRFPPRVRDAARSYAA